MQLLQDHLRGGRKHPASLSSCPPLPLARKHAAMAQKVLLVAILMVKLLEVEWGLEVENGAKLSCQRERERECDPLSLAFGTGQQWWGQLDCRRS